MTWESWPMCCTAKLEHLIDFFFLSLNVMSNFSFISLVNIISAFRVDFVLVLIDWSGRPLPWHLYLHTVQTHISELQSWPSQIYVSEGLWISWFLGCARKERAVMEKCRTWTGRCAGHSSRQRMLLRRGSISHHWVVGLPHLPQLIMVNL